MVDRRFQYPGTVGVVSTEPETVTESRWHQPWSEPVRTNFIATALIVASGLTYGYGEIVDSSKWFAHLSEPVRTNWFHTCHQQAATIDPSALLEVNSEDKWHQAWSVPPVLIKPGLLACQQQFFTHDTYPYENPETSYGWRPSYPDYIFTIKLPIAAYPFTSIDPDSLTRNETITEDKWHQGWSIPSVLSKIGLGAHLQQTSTIDPYAITQPEAVSEDKWHQPWSELIDKARPGLRAANQQFTTIDPYAITQPEATSEDKWHQPWSVPQTLAKQGLGAHHQQAFAYTFALAELPFTELKGWFNWLSTPPPPKPGLAAARQQFFTTDPRSLTQPEAVLESKWHQPWSEPYLKVVRIGLGVQSHMVQAWAPPPPSFPFAYGYVIT